ncbi:MAG: zinc ribbon domain-containing protein [Lachnospiraceae bacterium]|nr:zinc ribbon domain-containing protein [Lachnospiraceae bacterium]
MFGMISLEEISGSSFLEILKNLVLQYVPDGETILRLLSDYPELFLSLGIAVGISQCFFGYAMRRLWTAILSVVLCGCCGAAFAVGVSLKPEGLAVATAVAAVLGGIVGYSLWIAGCFLRSFFIVGTAVFILFVMDGSNVPGLITGLAAGLVAGIATVAFYRVCLVLYTALFGGLLAGACILGLAKADGYPVYIIGGLLAAAGIAVQFIMGRKSKVAAGAGMSAKEAAKRLKATTQMDTAAQLAAADEEGGETAQEKRPEEGGYKDGTVVSGNDFARPQKEEIVAAQEGSGENADTSAKACPSCGAPYSSRAKFCMQCGCKL